MLLCMAMCIRVQIGQSVEHTPSPHVVQNTHKQQKKVQRPDTNERIDPNPVNQFN